MMSRNVYSFSNNFKYVVPSGYENSDIVQFKTMNLSGILRYLMINNDLHVIILDILMILNMLIKIRLHSS